MLAEFRHETTYVKTGNSQFSYYYLIITSLGSTDTCAHQGQAASQLH